MLRLPALATLFFLVACGGTATTQTAEAHAPGSPTTGAERRAAHRDRNSDDLFAHSRAPTEPEAAFIAQLVRLTSTVRGLPVRHPVVTRVASAANISRHLISTIDDEDIVDLVDVYVAIGMLEPGTDVVAILARVVGEQVVGFYDPELDVLVVRDDVMAELTGDSVDPETLVTIAHEIIHALQGQNLELRARMDEERETDFEDAYQALVEGDATLGMLVVAARVSNMPVREVLAAVSTDLDFAGTGMAGPESAELAAAPPILRIGMTAPYIAGLGFCRAIYERVGYAGVDSAHARRATTTEQVMHPEKYFAEEPADRIELGTVEAVDAEGFQTVREDTLGELEVGIYLGRGQAAGIDTAAGAGWGGDRIRLYRRGTELAAIFAASFDTEADAVEAEVAAHRSDALESGRFVIRVGRLLYVARGFPSALNHALRDHAQRLANPLSSPR